MFTTPPGGAGNGKRRWRDAEGGSERRGVSPRRARATDVGLGQTPPPKRPAGYVQPGPAQGPELNTQMISNELYRQRDAIAALHTWVTSIHEASVDHAEQIEGAARHFSQMQNEVQDMKQKLGVGLSTAEANLEGTFQKVDQIIAEVKADTMGKVGAIEGLLKGMSDKYVGTEVKITNIE